MSKISIKKDFKNGDKLYDVDLNNNFAVIEAGVNANEENLEEIIEEAEARLTAVFEEESAETEAAVAADNLATKNAIIADNDATAAEIAADNLATKNAIIADNDATEAAIKADNDATEAAIVADNASTVEQIRTLVVNEGWDWGGSSTERVRFFKGNTSAVSGQSVVNGQLLFDLESGIISLDDNNSRKLMGGALWDETPKKPVKYKRKTSAEIEVLPIEDGSVIYNTDNGKQFMDVGSSRIPTGGAGGEVILEDETVTDDTKLILEDEDLDFQGLEISDEYTTGDNVAYSANYANKAFGGKILWTNPNPTSNFAGQTIQISSTDYDILEIFYATIQASSGAQVKSVKTINGYNAILDFYDGYSSKGGLRTATISGNQITFSNSFFDSSSGTQNYCVPLYIIGYKTELFN